MNIPIFDGFLKSNRIQQNRVQIRQLENTKINLEDNIELEKFQAKSNLRNSLMTLEVQEENRALALEVFEMTQIKYEEGVGSNLEVVEADSALKEAETNYFSALYDALVAKVDLEKALGILR
jgi:outer membrane protein TolC